MMKNIGIVFSRAPHGSARGREALDLVLASSALTENISIFFIGDAVFHLLPEQHPEKILMRDYIRTLGLLDIYDIQKRYVAYESLAQRGFTQQINWVMEFELRSLSEIRELLANCDSIITF